MSNFSLGLLPAIFSLLFNQSRNNWNFYHNQWHERQWWWRRRSHSVKMGLRRLPITATHKNQWLLSFGDFLAANHQILFVSSRGNICTNKIVIYINVCAGIVSNNRFLCYPIHTHTHTHTYIYIYIYIYIHIYVCVCVRVFQYQINQERNQRTICADTRCHLNTTLQEWPIGTDD